MTMHPMSSNKLLIFMKPNNKGTNNLTCGTAPAKVAVARLRYVCLYVSHFSFRPGSHKPGFADVGPKVLIRYYYHSYGAQVLCWRLSLGEDGKRPTYQRGGVAKCAKGIQNAHFSKGQKLTHSRAHVEKHAGQETPLHYTH